MKIDFIEQAAHAGVVNPEEYIPVELIEDIDTSLQNFFDLYDGLDRMKQLQSECSNPVPNALGRVLMENLPASDGTDIDRRIQFIFMNAEECGHPGVRALHEGLPEL